ncbi:MAG: TetM/TetW/TetO/TetS family tetracycline resistance ribosomal protection protein [Oscillospiraceae bacterium]|nr:TetM/TetW/TetO/TetS family tetracycline resistance ribosomal protection protein [Oscillospiraceae bacterium]
MDGREAGPAERPLCLGVLAHVDAGKTTLCEALLHRAGVLNTPGRVDHGDTALDTHALERRRGITIFSAQAAFFRAGRRVTLLDTPGHVDFSGEMERTLAVLDCAVLVISGTDGVQAHTETLWELLRAYRLPVFLFVTKMDLPGAEREAVLGQLRERLDERVMDFTGPPPAEELAMCDEALLDRYLAEGTLTESALRAAVARRRLYPCWFGSGLRLEGIDGFLDGALRYAPAPDFGEAFGARVFKISRDAGGRRLTHLRLTGGTLRVRQPLRYADRDGAELEEKLTGLLLSQGAKLRPAEELSPGDVGAVLGLSRSWAGQGLGTEADAPLPLLAPALRYRLSLPEGVDAAQALPLLRQLEEEEPLLRVSWSARSRELSVQLMGRVQIEVLKSLIAERFGWEVQVDAGQILYRETIAAPVEGCGHYEPLRHYAEVHLLLEPLPPGSGVELDTRCPTDALELNWQRLILTHLAEKRHLGVLTGSPITDLRISLLAGRAHEKHTEGGDFRQATYRAVRQGLMKAQSVLLEPVYRFTLEVPPAQTGRAISDLRTMHARFDCENGEHGALLRGICPVDTMRAYAAQVAAYTGGRGRFSCQVSGYQPCHDTAKVVAALGYDPEADLDNSPDSVFCAHGAATLVKWDKADAWMHLDTGYGRDRSAPPAPRLRMRPASIDEAELEAIMEREFGPIRRPMYTRPAAQRTEETGVMLRTRRETLVVDGYNLIFSWDELRALAEGSLDSARSRLTEILISYHGFTGSELILVFDGYAKAGNPGEKELLPGVRVVYTKENETADQYIERLLHDIGKNAAVRVVTSDNLIRLSALGSGIRRTGAREFGSEVDWAMGQIAELVQRTARGSHMTRLADARPGGEKKED